MLPSPQGLTSLPRRVVLGIGSLCFHKDAWQSSLASTDPRAIRTKHQSVGAGCAQVVQPAMEAENLLINESGGSYTAAPAAGAAWPARAGPTIQCGPTQTLHLKSCWIHQPSAWMCAGC